jgi:methylenetetrahydrofolate reductase (NADPH)
MKTPAGVTPEATITRMLHGYSIEINPADAKAVSLALDRLPTGTEVFLTWIPGTDPLCMVEPAMRLSRAGLLPVPHIGARHLESTSQLDEVAKRLAQSGVDRILAIGGDRAKPVGPFDSSLAVMQTEAFQKAGINRIGVAGFPEGHPTIPSNVLEHALAAKISFADRAGIKLFIMSQFCFKAEPIIHWLRELRRRGIHNQVRVGLAGPAGLFTLTRYALRCGVGNSLRVLTEHPSFAKLLVEKGPEPIIRELAEFSTPAENEDLSPGLTGLHFFVFGGLGKTIDWINAER